LALAMWLKVTAWEAAPTQKETLVMKSFHRHLTPHTVYLHVFTPQ
jgi:hypothetical protein